MASSKSVVRDLIEHFRGSDTSVALPAGEPEATNVCRLHLLLLNQLGPSARFRMSYAGAVDDTVRRELAQGERVVWTGQPGIGAVLWDQLYTFAFSLAWNGFGFYMLLQPEPQQEWFPLLIVVLLLAFGLYIFGSAILEVLEAPGTRYTITDRRLIITRSSGSRPAYCLRLSTIRGAERIGSNRCRATIRIPMGMVDDGDGGERMDYLKMHGVREPAEVCRLLTA